MCEKITDDFSLLSLGNKYFIDKKIPRRGILQTSSVQKVVKDKIVQIEITPLTALIGPKFDNIEYTLGNRVHQYEIILAQTILFAIYSDQYLDNLVLALESTTKVDPDFSKYRLENCKNLEKVADIFMKSWKYIPVELISLVINFGSKHDYEKNVMTIITKFPNAVYTMINPRLKTNLGDDIIMFCTNKIVLERLFSKIGFNPYSRIWSTNFAMLDTYYDKVISYGGMFIVDPRILSKVNKG